MATHNLPCFRDPSRLLFVLESDVYRLHHIKEALKASYALQLFDKVSSLLHAFNTMRRPDLTLLSWDSTRCSTSVLKEVMAASLGSPVLLLSAPPRVENVVLEMRLCPTGFLRNPFDQRQLEDAVEQQLTRTKAVAPSIHLAKAETRLGDGSFFVRSSHSMHEVEAQATLIAGADIPVLILGESGTGKEVLAKYIHLASNRSENMFLKVNCAAMPAELLESELFGYEKGAFTGATDSRPGKFEICNGGTIFLDEIGEMSTAFQAKFLHVLQDGTYSRLGSRTTMKANVRVIAATNIDMKSAIANKSFREDLYYRLNGFSLTLPPLRERREEIPTFAHHFMKKGATKFGREPLPLSRTLLQALISYAWPGNLRELENIINRYLVIGDERLVLKDLTTEAAVWQAPQQPLAPASDIGLRQQIRSLKGNAESAAIARALDETRWNRRAAARKMKISYTSLRYKIKQYDLGPPPPSS